jgi:hypothetical protein
MPKIEVSMLIFALLMWSQTSTSTVSAQTAPAITSADTVEALLQAENKSIMQRANATSPQSAAQATVSAQTAPVNKEVALLSVYGVSSDLRIDVKYGDFIYAGLASGQRVGPLQVVSIDGICTQLLMLQEAQRPVQHCWSLALANRQPPSPSKPESVQNTPLPSGMNLPSLPGFSGLPGLPRGVSPAASLPTMSH